MAIRIINNVSWISNNEMKLLQTYAACPFNLGQFTSLENILTQLEVSVVIEPDIITTNGHPAYDDTLDYWRKEMERLKEFCKHDESRHDEYFQAMRIFEELSYEKQFFNNFSLRGCYDARENVVRLFPNEMKQEYDGVKMDELLVSTLAHEVMHAYFSRFDKKDLPYVICVEEPLAELGMLLFLHETGSSYYAWAYNDVSSKKTCYRYGAKLMDQCLREGSKSATRKYVEDYKILIESHSVFIVNSANGSLVLPPRLQPVQNVNGNTILANWENVIAYPPKYFYDEATKTLGLDGIWNDHGSQSRNKYGCLHKFIDIDIDIDIDTIYLGEHYRIFHPYSYDLTSNYPVTISPRNTELKAINGIPVYIKDNKPALRTCGDGLYEICRGGKRGVIDEHLNQVVPCKYDSIWSFDENGLMEVENDGKYGLINKQGKEQVPVVYEDIDNNKDGSYTVKQDGVEFKIDSKGRRIAQ